MAHGNKSSRKELKAAVELIGSVFALCKLAVENTIPRRRGSGVLLRSLFVSVSANGDIVALTVYPTNSPLAVKSFSDLTYLLSYMEMLQPRPGFPATLYQQLSSSSVASKWGRLGTQRMLYAELGRPLHRIQSAVFNADEGL